MSQEQREKAMAQARGMALRVKENVQRVIRGKEGEVELALLGLLSGGHLLVEDVPGVGKTTLTKSLARSVGCSFKRIQCTPDLLPSDILGAYVYNQKTGDFEFRPGPVVAQMVLVDEVNRASPRTQSALLECMEERQITVDGLTHLLPRPFWVMATQNPIEYQGTFPLPEAQVDRFSLCLRLGYPGFAHEVQMIEQQREVHPIEGLAPVMEAPELLQVQQVVRQVYGEAPVREYIVYLVEATRHHPSVQLGASPRGSLALFRCAQALALLRGRDYILPDDVKELAPVSLAHRLILNSTARMKGLTPREVVAEIVGSTPVPGARGRGA